MAPDDTLPAPRTKLTRRRFLGMIGVAAGGSAGVGCSDSGDEERSADRTGADAVGDVTGRDATSPDLADHAAISESGVDRGDPPAPAADVGGGRRTPDGAPRHILVITADDLGWKDVSSYGNQDVATPAIDRLASEGTSFARMFDAASTCSSSRASFVTGQYPHTHGVLGLTHRNPEFALPAGTPILPSWLRDAGYRTAIEGKWDLANHAPPGGYGYDEILNVVPVTTVISGAGRTRAWLREHRDEAFYLEINYMNTHRDGFGRFSAAAGFEVDPEAISVPAYWALPDVEGLREEIANYYSQLLAMDAMIGEVLDELDALGMADDTLVLFVSDNGAPYPGNKTTLYDRGTGTPFILRWPGRIPAGAHRDHLCSTIDLAPTVLAAANLPIPETIQGTSLLPVVDDSGLPGSAEVFSEMTYHSSYRPMRAIRTADHKYIRNFTDRPHGLGGGRSQPWADPLARHPDARWLSEPKPHEELYDLRVDPDERTNLVADAAASATLGDLRARLDAHMQATDDPFVEEEFVEGA